MVSTGSWSFIAIKLLGISYVTIIYFLMGFLVAKGLDRVLADYDKINENKKPIWQVILEILVRLCLLGVLIYMARNIVERIPFPLDGVLGFNYKRLKELDNEFIFTIPVFIYHTNFSEKIMDLYKRLAT
jgi:hypothetical protein